MVASCSNHDDYEGRSLYHTSRHLILDFGGQVCTFPQNTKSVDIFVSGSRASL
jgi:hypothetical protein